MKTQFYERLETNDEFCCALGKVLLLASKLEILIKQYLKLYGVEVLEKRATLGNLIRILKENDHLSTNGEMHFNLVSTQRNYLIHNLYGSFVDEIENKLLPVEDLIDMDIDIYIEKVEQTKENFSLYVEIVSSAIKNKNNENNKGDEPLL